MPMPSIVWDYFDEFEGGGKCRLCGCIRNRKDKSTSTFWQHLERVHGLDKRQMLINSSTNNLPSGKMRQSTDSNVETSNVHKRTVQKDVVDETEPIEKMPKLELMANLDRQTEETFKFISELVKQQSQSSPVSVSCCASQKDNIEDPQTEEVDKAKDELPTKNTVPVVESTPIIPVIESTPIGISLNSLELEEACPKATRIIENISSGTKTPGPEHKSSSLNDYINGINGILDNFPPKNGTLSPSAKTKFGLAKAKSPVPIAEVTPTKKRQDYLNWDEFFMSTAILSAQRSKDPCTQVGACIVKDNIIIGIGYNGMPNGCNDDEMPWGKRDADPLNTKYPYVCHAEMNAILNKNNADIRNATIYTTMFPCCECAKLIIQSRINKVIYLKNKDAIEMTASRRLFDITGVEYSQFKPSRDEFTIRFN